MGRWSNRVYTVTWYTIQAKLVLPSPLDQNSSHPSHTLGTMLFGEGTDAATAHHLLDTALEAGVTLFDTAEMYPVPQCAATQGDSERIVGEWLRTRAGVPNQYALVVVEGCRVMVVGRILHAHYWQTLRFTHMYTY